MRSVIIFHNFIGEQKWGKQHYPMPAIYRAENRDH